MYALKTSNNIIQYVISTYTYMYSNRPFNSDNNATETLEESAHVNGNSHNFYPSQKLKGNFCEGN